ncbi:thioesterase family protein [Bradyrhizobium australiense]|uniref:Uncharacterized protein n=1 Tax=Bradyrhizobium australiense TaxID=2721161 RepID=A0A7Y4H0A5_9BRAD|nr:thioesterase family protein [Bradyrhizobium australiense]NOJ44562.1 hypothetical protein [Bradyrhizobium australiense]
MATSPKAATSISSERPLLRYIGLDGEYLSNSGSYRTVETHLFHLRALHACDRVQVLTQALGADDTRLHLFHVLTCERDDGAVATGEQILFTMPTVDAADPRRKAYAARAAASITVAFLT